LAFGVIFVSDEPGKPQVAAIVWEGDSLEVLRSFPEGVMQNFGFELWKSKQRFRVVKARLAQEKKREKRG
jgi:hypothetical protein